MLDLLACSIYKKNPHCSPCERHYPPRPTVSRCFCLTAHNLPYISFAAVRQLNNCRNKRAEIKHFAPKIKQKLNESWDFPQSYSTVTPSAPSSG